MSDNSQKMMSAWDVVPPTAKFIAALVYVGFAAFIWFVPMRHDNEMRNWPNVGVLAFVFVMPVFMTIYALLIGFVYGDAKRRRMRHVMWTWLAALVPNAVGIILYFIIRDPLPKPCPKCAQAVPSTFVFCPHCGTALVPRCSNCGKPMEREWTHCAFCGVPAGAGAK